MTHHEHTKELYACPMHPEVQQEHPGSCPKCGMRLVKNNTDIGGAVRTFNWSIK